MNSPLFLPRRSGSRWPAWICPLGLAVFLSVAVMPAVRAEEPAPIVVNVPYTGRCTEGQAALQPPFEVRLRFSKPGEALTVTVNAIAGAGYSGQFVFKNEFTSVGRLPDEVTVDGIDENGTATGKSSYDITFTWNGRGAEEVAVLLKNAVIPVGPGGGGAPPDMNFRLRAMCYFIYCQLERGGAQLDKLVMAANTTATVVGRLIIGNGHVPDSGTLKLTVPAGTVDHDSQEINRSGRVYFKITSPDAGSAPADMVLENTAVDSTWGEPSNLTAQPFKIKMNVVKLELDSVTFTGGGFLGLGARMFSLMTDRGTKYPTPHWAAQNASPVGYIRNKPMSATARFKVSPATFSGNIDIVGLAGSVSDFPVKTVTASGGAATYPDIKSGGSLPDTVAFLNPFQVKWTYQPAGAWVEGLAGSSSNPVYVSLAKPTTGNLYHSVVHYACGTGNAANEAAASINTWSFFASAFDAPADITTWDKAKLKYYGTPDGGGNESTSRLLSNHDGTCLAFTRLFRDALAVNRISAQLIEAKPPKGENAFLVKKIQFAEPGTAPYSPYVYWIREINMLFFPELPGQNTAPPKLKLFSRHALVKFGMYFDPSYGVSRVSSDNYTPLVVDGYGKEVDDDGDTKLVFRKPRSVPADNLRFRVWED